MAGRKPKPTQLHVIAGNPGHRPLNKQEPKPPPSDTRKPTRLTGEAAKEWRRIAKLLKEAGLLTTIDREALALYCDTYALYIEAMDKLREGATIIDSPSGYPIQNPYLSIVNRQGERMQRLLTEFGMTPSSRSRVSVNPPDQGADDWDDL